MELICNSTQFQLEKPSAVAIGKFDGMHLGHQFLLRKLSDTAKELTKVVFTFDPSPAVFFSGEALPSLFTREEKREVFRTMGIDVLIEFPLNKETASTPPEAFLKEILHERLRAKRIVAGEDLSFGRHGAGDFTLLNLLAKTYGYETELVEKSGTGGRRSAPPESARPFFPPGWKKRLPCSAHPTASKEA